MFIKRNFLLMYDDDYFQNIHPLIESGHTAKEIIQANQLIGWVIE